MVIKKTLFFLAGFISVAVFIFAALAFFPQSVSNVNVSGLHLRSQNWSGTITITGDTLFVPWVTLRIEPGTKILFDKNPDILNTPWAKFADAYITENNDPTGREGYNQSHFDLAAKIVAIGTKGQPIVFTSSQIKPEYADWDQLVLFGGSILDNVEVSYAHNGVYAGTDGAPFDWGKVVKITNSSLHDSLWSCIDVWSANVIITNNEIYNCWHQAIGIKANGNDLISDNNIHDSQLSVNCEKGATPKIINNHFEAAPINPDCPTGEGNVDIGRVADTIGGTYNGKLIYPSNYQQ